jgi:toxin FitB
VTGWLLDTTILSELRRPRPERKVVTFVAGQPLDLLRVSSVTFAEIRFGIELVADPARRAGPYELHSEQPLDLAILPQMDRLCGRDARQARHRHDVAADRHHEAGAGGQTDLAHRQDEAFGRAHHRRV